MALDHESSACAAEVQPVHVEPVHTVQQVRGGGRRPVHGMHAELNEEQHAAHDDPTAFVHAWQLSTTALEVRPTDAPQAPHASTIEAPHAPHARRTPSVAPPTHPPTHSKSALAVALGALQHAADTRLHALLARPVHAEHCSSMRAGWLAQLRHTL
mmetsp:Transcript_78294/g.155601  ORF Transcript_78294/g.155601 Transcript_78294/m.155601 type:complete len:156 (-) Transcript_78294:35-502(-)|eukprot:CAMPEP_0174733662 /NCGR_PEP_ID=MMETSP1094-20130205/61774_1 /TAXON_ID=156173 /ORGANISM="Chrysochromulina brevifilum, Strain UTEX LB 985" /LENGTH=155 /DNA_ID=CAMNT_0015936359 /DNA_START=390 /DNA_END=857 /DNA_ORIENTATION=+